LAAVDAAVGPLGKPGGWRVVDLGSGSGLCGRLFRKYCDRGAAAFAVDESSAEGFFASGPDLRVSHATATLSRHRSAVAGRMVGVDLSSKMVAVARDAGG
jgi:ubiquinone/menaquinone biosynthesis C-methylase UbiE